MNAVRIVILNWNAAADTIACLESLKAADLRGASVMVVDNGSRDGSVGRLRTDFPGLRILALPENRGYAGGNNAGIRVALDEGAEGVLLLNSDTRVAPDFLPPLLDAMASSPTAGAVSSAIFRMDRPEMLDVAWCEVHFAQRHVVQIIGVNALPGEGYDRRREVPVAIGCSLLLKAEALRQVGLFDEAYFAYHEDVDWCLRARRAGWELFYEPFSRVYHRGSGSTRALSGRPPAVVRKRRPELPNAEPLPWNPVRTYLGIRNTIRLLRTYADPREKRSFARACLRELPLELTAVLMGEQARLRLGDWSWKTFLHEYFVARHPTLTATPRGAPGWLRRALGWLVLLPVDVLWVLPRDVLRGCRQGRFREVGEYLRGLRDGLLDRPLPLERLGLR
ncbi:MAG TPA: glycosyltransferase family 2 protein [Candidatus Binatia bacterium]|nr:glycosyltransferase family 2 protein [Candidatus Binatia bacterium]